MTSVDAVYQILGSPATCTPVVAWFLSSILAFPKYDDAIFEPKERIKPVTIDQIACEYDFIIIGSGKGGAVVANRLSEEANWKVLLLESGVDETPVSDCPLFANKMQKSNVDYGFQTEPSCKACLAMKDKRCSCPSGKSLGGSTIMNYMHYIRGNKKDFNNWADAGNEGWCYNDVLPYFKKSEDNDNAAFTCTCYHSTGGLLSVSDPLTVTPMADAFVEAGTQMGYDIVDSNGAKQSGFSVSQGIMRHGKRCSVAKAFLRPARDRKNLHIAINTTVNKINIDPCTKIAKSVTIVKDGKTRTIKATKEIILSAGVINSPKILMLSGVGPAKHLESVKIKPIVDLPVGQNLQDQVSFGGLIFRINETIPTKQSLLTKDRVFIKYAQCGTGLLSVKKGAEATGFISTCKVKKEDDYPDIQLIFSPGSLLSDNGVLKRANGLTDEFFNTVYGCNINKDAYTIYPILLRPKSRGSVKLRSCNPKDKPIIDPNYFSHPDDMAVLKEGVKFVLKLAKSPALQAYGSKIYDVPFPACADKTFMSDQYIECAIRQYTYMFFNSAGTCKMGPACDPTSVVDPELRVIGIQNLRVVDSSVKPTIISGNSAAPTIMVAEKASDMIKATWKEHHECDEE